MSIGLLALLDDVAVFARTAAASLDDVAAQSMKAGSKAAAVVIDDAAVTPKYVVGFSAQRELPIIFKIALASLKNKVLILLPIVVAFTYFAPAAMTVLLMVGGAYLCYEGAEKVYEFFFPHEAHEHEAVVLDFPRTPEELEQKTVAGAIRTDFILSAEIMAISSATVMDSSVVSQIVILALIGLFLTIAVYGVVAIIVKLDDVGLALSKNQIRSLGVSKSLATFGRGLVLAMPKILTLLTVVGTIAMTWVGGSIIAHGLHSMGLTAPEDIIHHGSEWVSHHSLPSVAPVVAWLATSMMQAVFGILVGAIVIPLVQFTITPVIGKLRKKK